MSSSAIELINIKIDAIIIIFGLTARIKNKIGLKNIPPPIPTTPEIKPNVPPINREITKGISHILMSSYDLNLTNNNKPAIDRQ